jgi:hypothetical protein
LEAALKELGGKLPKPHAAPYSVNAKE